MTACEMCGKDKPLVSAMVEGSQVRVCMDCGKYGKVLQKPISFQSVQKKTGHINAEPEETLVADFAKKVHAARERSGLTQKEFALKLNEKESIIQKIENGSFQPPIEMARRLEKLLKVQLVEVEKVEVEEQVESTKRSGPLTIGDLINLKK